MNKTELAAIYKSALETTLGLIASSDDDGDVVFRFPGLGSLCITLEEQDPEFLQIILPISLDGDDIYLPDTRIMELVNAANVRSKIAKLSLKTRANGKKALYVTAEMLVAAADTPPKVEHIKAILLRTISALHAAVLQIMQAIKVEQDTTTTELVH